MATVKKSARCGKSRLRFLFIGLFCLTGVTTGCNPTTGTVGVVSPSPSPSAGPSSAPTASPLPTRPSPRPSSAANETICPGSSTLSGIDVSSYDAGTVWSTVAHSGRKFAFVKATEGLTYMNPTFSTDWPAIASNGLVRGAYHYFHPTDDPIQQADYFLTTVGNFGANDLPPLFDWEETDGVSAETDVQNALVWLQRVSAATGKTPIVYADPSFINGLGNPSALSQYPFFIANYNVTCPAIPPPWNGWLFWQTGTGSASGVPDASADLDVFNGTVSQLQLFASTGVY